MLGKAILNLVPQRANNLKQLWDEPGAWNGVSGGSYIGWNKNPLTGQWLTEEDIFYCSIAWRCMTLIGGSVSRLPRYLWRELPNEGREKARTHPNFKTISIRPNSEQTWQQYDMMRILRFFIYGNSYCQKIRNDRGDVIALNPLHPSRMFLDRGADGSLLYHYSPMSGETIPPLTQAQVHHIAAPSIDGIQGISTCALAQKSISILKDFDEFQQRFLQNDSTPPFVFSTEAILPPDKKKEIWDAWQEKHAGLVNKFKAGGVLDGGLRPVAMPLMSSRDAENDLSIRRNISAVARYFGVPEHMLGILDRSTNNNIQQQSLEYLLHCLDPILTAFQQCMERDFLRDDERTRLFIEYDVDSLQWTDLTQRDESLARLLLAGAMKINEVRTKLNLNPDPHGDVLLIPTANAPNGEVITKPEPEKNDKKEEKPADKKEKKKVDEKDGAALADDIFQLSSTDLKLALWPLFEDAAARTAKREIEYLEETVRRLKAGKPLCDAINHARDFYTTTHKEALKTAFAAPVQAALKMLPGGPAVEVEKALEELAEKIAGKAFIEIENCSTYSTPAVSIEVYCKQWIEVFAKSRANDQLMNLFKAAGVNHDS